MQLLTPQSLKAFFDANPLRYKTAYSHWAVLGDGYLPSDALDYQLCTPYSEVPNPVAVAPHVPKPFTVESLFALLTISDVEKIAQAAFGASVLASINAQDRPACINWTNLCAAAGLITSAEQTAVLSEINGTIADPSWAAMVPAPCDLALYFADGQGNRPSRLELALNSDGTKAAPNGILFINRALGR